MLHNDFTVVPLPSFTEPLAAEDLAAWRRFPAAQQPDWPDADEAGQVLKELANRPGLVTPAEVSTLHGLLAEVAAGRLAVLQAGDCAEDPAQCKPPYLTAKIAQLSELADLLSARNGTPVLRVGRIAGQFAKPRSMTTELTGGQHLPSFRGLIVNDPAPDPSARRPDPLRMLTCYSAARDASDHLRGAASGDDRVWTSHEALLADYELPLVRRGADDRLWLTSTHWPWIGDRTRDPDGLHVQLLAAVANPVALKVGPKLSSAELLRLAERLDPDRVPGRLTLISRLGAGRTFEQLPELVEEVRAAGHPAIWLCDPMHANTVLTGAGRKTRVLTTIRSEVSEFGAAIRAGGAVAGGLHLEITPEDVGECVDHEGALDTVGRSTTLCDPRLNRRQAVSVMESWTAGGEGPR
ncbi:phospho-2-dehydro-3-deoxyheptonate aldolase [Kribbella antibiotica]|uniref:Phospho-2-dehydro-3-deoxyheptonate aldolase n=1 Tax=Kribbella antibiotica TaxID=190195 RepID=A0A4R4ZUA6_9ACTN|nr:3-deoxy-7-phosphoheptulonate synthase [Kribbella antibiotica]TDD62703.1 phospho-2-dehydro-3-deoxyheptonate aldolase [Kribbella antibiotica]